MSKKIIRRKASAPVIEPEGEEEEEVEEEEVEEEEVEEESVVKQSGRRRLVNKRRPEPEDEGLDEEDEEESVVVTKSAPVKKVVTKSAPVKKVVTKSAPTGRVDTAVKRPGRPVVAKAVPDNTVGQGTTDDMFEAIMQALEAGYVLGLRRVAGKVLLYNAGATDVLIAARRSGKGGHTMTKAQFEGEVFSDEFKEFLTIWRELTYEEKVSEAEKAKAVWEKHENPKVNVIRLTEAYRTATGVEKYKPQYRSRSAREDLYDRGIKAIEG